MLFVYLFDSAVRHGSFSGPSYDRLAKCTVKEAVDQVAACFRANLRCDPCHNTIGNEDPLLKSELQGYKSEDPPVKQQRVLTIDFLRQCAYRAISPSQKAYVRILVIVLFFGMRSCECSITTGPRKTHPVELRGVRFFCRDRSIIAHDDREIFKAYAVSLTFIDEKNRNKWESTTTEYANDPFINSVMQCAHLVWKLRAAPGTTDTTQMYHYFADNKLHQIKQTQLLTFLRATACSVGESTLGFHPNEIGNKSIRSGAAMGWLLDGHRLEMVMMMGRWLSTAF